MGLRAVVSGLACLWLACAKEVPVPKVSQAPVLHAWVHPAPLADSLAATRRLLEEKGLSFEDSKDSGQLTTPWEAPEVAADGAVTRSRYVVVGTSLGARRSRVRIFRVSVQQTDDAAAWKLLGEKQGARVDLSAEELERELAPLLSGGSPAVATAAGASSGDGGATEGPPTLRRSEDFYLTGWKDAESREVGCGEPVRGLTELLHPGRTLLIGEQLGSREAPSVVGNVVCQAAERGLPVALGLSIPMVEQEGLDRYLASRGAPEDQEVLLGGRFWRRPYQDGRSSRAILELVDRVRAMRAAGLRVVLVAYDTDTVQGSVRDAWLGAQWRRRRAAHPEELHIVLAGNAHTRTVTGAAWDTAFVPMAFHLRHDPSLVVLELGYAKGHRWGCDLKAGDRLRCDVVEASPGERVAEMPGLGPYIRRFKARTEDGFDGLLYVGALTPSPPALEPDALPPPPPEPFPLTPTQRKWQSGMH